MENVSFDQFGSFGKVFMDSAKELETINAKVLEQVTQKQMDLMNTAVDTGHKFVSLMSESKGYQDLVGEQTKLASDYAEKVMSTARETMEILANSREDYQAWFESHMKAATDSAQSIVPAEMKSAA